MRIQLNLALIILTLLIYWPITGHEFLSFDDSQYVTENPRVTHGLNFESLVWAFTESYASNWHPLTWLSHMLDFELFGLEPSVII